MTTLPHAQTRYPINDLLRRRWSARLRRDAGLAGDTGQSLRGGALVPFGGERSTVELYRRRQEQRSRRLRARPGYPAEPDSANPPTARERKPLAEFVFSGQFGQAYDGLNHK